MISSPRQPTTLQEIQYNPPRLRTFNENNEEFCSKSNVEESLRYLDKELQMLGLQTLYNSHGSFDLIQLVNVAHRLLRKYQHSGRYKEELETRVHRCSADLEHSQVTQKRLRQSNKALQNSINKYEETERQFQLERSSLQTKLKLQQDEVRKLNLLLQSTDNQHRHESKKREKELNSLKERTQQLLVDKSKSGASIEISRCLSRQDGRRRQWRSEASNSRNEEDLYQVVMSNFEKRCAALQSENSSLRDLLSDVLQELEELSSLGHPFLHKSVKKEHCQMPVDMIYKRLSESIRQACSHLRTNLSSASAAEPDLNSTFIVDAKDGNATVPDVVDDASLSLLEEKEEFLKERSVFYSQKAKFEQEKLNLTESTLKLHRERKKFEESKLGLSPPKMSETRLSLSPRMNISPGRSNREQEHVDQIKLAVKQSSSSTNHIT